MSASSASAPAAAPAAAAATDGDAKAAGAKGADEWTVEISSKGEFKNLLRAHDFVIVKFTMPTCKPCKLIDPVLRRLAKANPALRVATVNVLDRGASEVSDRYAVERVPTCHFFHQNRHLNDLGYAGSRPDEVEKRAALLFARAKK